MRWEGLNLVGMTIVPQCPPAPEAGALLRLHVSGYSPGKHETYYIPGGMITFTADDNGVLTLETYCPEKQLKRFITLLHRYGQSDPEEWLDADKEAVLPGPEITILPPAASRPPRGGYYEIRRTAKAYDGDTALIYFECYWPSYEDFYIPMARDVAVELGQRLTADLGIKPSRQQKPRRANGEQARTPDSDEKPRLQ